jgi:hypothetical protein
MKVTERWEVSLSVSLDISRRLIPEHGANRSVRVLTSEV